MGKEEGKSEGMKRKRRDRYGKDRMEVNQEQEGEKWGMMKEREERERK